MDEALLELLKLSFLQKPMHGTQRALHNSYPHWITICWARRNPQGSSGPAGECHWGSAFGMHRHDRVLERWGFVLKRSPSAKGWHWIYLYTEVNPTDTSWRCSVFMQLLRWGHFRRCFNLESHFRDLNLKGGRQVTPLTFIQAHSSVSTVVETEHSQLHICSNTPLCVAVGWLLDFLDLRCFLLLKPLKAYLLKQPMRQTSDTQK